MGLISSVRTLISLDCCGPLQVGLDKMRLLGSVRTFVPRLLQTPRRRFEWDGGTGKRPDDSHPLTAAKPSKKAQLGRGYL